MTKSTKCFNNNWFECMDSSQYRILLMYARFEYVNATDVYHSIVVALVYSVQAPAHNNLLSLFCHSIHSCVQVNAIACLCLLTYRRGRSPRHHCHCCCFDCLVFARCAFPCACHSHDTLNGDAVAVSVRCWCMIHNFYF